MRLSLPALALLAAAGAAQAAEPVLVGCAPDNPYYKAYIGMTNEIFVPRNVEPIPKYYPEEFISHNQDAGGSGTTKVTLAMMKRLYDFSFKVFGERNIENEMIICQGEFVIARTVITSKMTGAWGEQPATNRTARISATDIYRFNAQVKVIERWGDADNLSMLWQLGLKLPPPPPGFKVQ